MKNIKITIEMTVTDEFFNEELVNMKENIQQAEKEFIEDSDGGMTQCNLTFEELD